MRRFVYSRQKSLNRPQGAQLVALDWMRAWYAVFDAARVQDRTAKVDLIPAQIAQLSGAQTMAVGHEDHGCVAVTMAIAASGLNQLLDLARREVLAGANRDVLRPPRRNCSYFAVWRDQLEMGIRHGNLTFAR
jgi:hypothetical protein